VAVVTGNATTRNPIGHGERQLAPPLAETLLASPVETAAADFDEIAELLATDNPRRARLLQSLARWWLEEFGDESEADWPNDVDALRARLSDIRGLGPQLIDRLLLFAGGLPVIPLETKLERIAARHGWLSPEEPPEAGRELFDAAARRSGLDAMALSHGLTKVASDFCQKAPDCERCPLRPDLPSNGPFEA